jgi:hypothetical protein
MTPQGSTALVLGKLVGAPIYPFVLWLAFVPWIVYGWTQLGPEQRASYASIYAVVHAMVFSILAGTLLASTLADIRGLRSDGKSIFALLFIAMTAAPLMSALVSEHAGPRGVKILFYDLALPGDRFLIVSSLVFGLWALAGAKWRIGYDLQEPPRAWRLPSFLAFLAFYVFGIATRLRGPDKPNETDAILTFAIVAAVGAVAALFSQEGVDQWKTWIVGRRGADRWHRTPVWIVAWSSVAGLGVLFFSVAREETTARLPLLMTVFLLRDLCTLQFCRLTRSRSPLAFGLVIVALMYLIPSLLLATSHHTAALYYVLPMPSDKVVLWKNLVPGVVQAGLAVWAVASRLTKQLRV